jgi:hypothetical protein|tara:strand:- start:5554 stop:5778 length:225 start_codon:yes stop_codon:yes gene_type:complete
MTDYDLSKPLQAKIKQRMDILQGWMEEDYHLKRPRVVEEHIKTITKFWSVMQEEDTDYIEGCRYAIENKSKWGV